MLISSTIFFNIFQKMLGKKSTFFLGARGHLQAGGRRAHASGLGR
jgi:hypothetical protein